MTFYGRVSQVQEAIRAFGASVVLISDHGFPEDDLMVVVRDALKLGCDIFMVPRLHQMTRQPSFREMIGAVPVVRLDHDPCRRLTWRAKRILDVIAAAAALILLSPLFLVIAIAVHIDNGAGILFRQTRLGRNAKPFELLKFRSMRPVSEGESATKWSISGDKRVTAVGRILRRTSLDELPQLWNVLRGDMTIVGPRPERPFFVDKFAAEDPEYTMRHRVRVGLTGLAQVNGLRGDTSISERSRFDNYYIENWSLWLDIKVILRTVFEVVGGRGR
jgi:exopolysaccharide biosynthesis polyprenyl glycosylphosphotransferase